MMDRELEIEIRKSLFSKLFNYATINSGRDVSTCFDASCKAVNHLLSNNDFTDTVEKLDKELDINLD